MKVVAALFIAFALVIGIVPQFTDCESQGHMLTLENGRSVSMKCHWTARGEIAAGLPLLFVGGLMLADRRVIAQRGLAMIGGILGLAAILIPTVLIGVCSLPEMICNMILKPTVLMAGILTMLAAVGGVLLTRSSFIKDHLAGA